jgi:hypothetical protein
MARKPAKTTTKTQRAAASKAKSSGSKAASSKPSHRPSPKKKVGAGKGLPIQRLRGFIRRKPDTKTHSYRPPRTISTGMSLDRKLDILGIGLALFGLLTLLSLLSISNSVATGSMLDSG